MGRHDPHTYLVPDLPMHQVFLHLESLKCGLLDGALQQRSRPVQQGRAALPSQGATHGQDRRRTDRCSGLGSEKCELLQPSHVGPSSEVWSPLSFSVPHSMGSGPTREGGAS